MRCVIGLLLACAAPVWGSEEWPQFRGPGGEGISDAVGLPTTWSEKENVKWKTAIPGRGWSSPVILSNQIWVTTATSDERILRALCFDRTSGSFLQDVEIFQLSAVERLGSQLSGLAAPTPVIEPGRLYVGFGTYGNACIDTVLGKPIWKNQEFIFGHDNNGPGSSPILYKDLYIVTCDGTDVRFMAALDKQTGRRRWVTPRSNVILTGPGASKSYCTPLVANIGGRDQLISPGAHRISSYEPATGKEIWSVDLPGWSIVPRPVLGRNLVYITTGGDKPELWAIRPDGQGGVTSTHVAWKYLKQVSMVPSLLLNDKLLYMVSTGGILTCLDAEKGSEIYVERLGGNHYSSPVLADGKMFFSNDTGQTFVVKPGSQFSVVATNTLESGIMASLAIAGKAIYVRTKTHLYRLEK